MRKRTYILLAVIALLVAACSPADEAGETTTTSDAAEETTTTESASPDAVELSYSLEPGTSFTYEVEMDQSIDLETTGDVSALAEEEGEDIPQDMSIRITGTTVFTHSVADGPEPGTFEIHITGDFSDMEFSGTIDGAPVDSADIPDFGTVDPIDMTIVVDENGNIIPSGEGDLGGDLFGSAMFGDFSQMFDPGMAGTGAGQFVGPPFGDEPVTVGDTWSETIEVPFMPDSDPIVTQIDSEVTGVDDIEGNEVFVIETTSVTSAFEFDFAELLLGFMFAFVPDDATDEQQAELDAIADELKFAFALDETRVDMTTWFDHEAGIARMAEFDSGVNMTMDIAMPDETTGELVAFGMKMDLTQHIVYRLSEAGSA